ncbi:MAG TPA: DUF2252 domain-containing protein [Rhodocyclaceae bacterium]
MPNLIEQIQTFNAGRDPERLTLKLNKIRETPFAFLRGTCHRFYQQLPDSALLSKAPSTWICGDLHLENFGSYKGDDRLVYFDMNDFDESALAPCTWELIRFLTSIRVGVTSLGVDGAEAIILCRSFIDAYSQALANGKARWVERDTASGLIKDLLDGLKQRNRPDYLDTRTVLKGKTRSIRIDGKKALAISAKQRSQVTDFMADFAATQENPDFFQVLDIARRIAGTGSLGVDRYIILVAGKGTADGNYLLDLKQSLPSALTPVLATPQPTWASEAARVVAVQQRMQAVSMAFLQAVTMDDKPYVLRGLQPSEDRVALEGWNGKLRRLVEIMTAMGHIVAWAQLRSSGRNGSAIADELIDFGHQDQWQSLLIDLSAHCAEQVTKDWNQYAKAFDQGAFASAMK